MVVCFLAGLKKDERLQLLEDWADGRVAVVVATIAFGMGIDKASSYWDIAGIGYKTVTKCGVD